MIETNCPPDRRAGIVSTSMIARRIDRQRQFAEGERLLEDRAGQRGGDLLADRFQKLVHRSVFPSIGGQRSIVPVRRIFFCSISTP